MVLAGGDPAHVPAPAPTLGYDIVDVFTDRAFAGNPLAVVYGADDLATRQLHAIATEFNLSETAFPVAMVDGDLEGGADYRVRIFTPGGEIPFAGHPTLGTAWSLARRGDIAPGARTQACRAGLVAVRVPAQPSDAVELSAVPRDAARALSPSEVEAIAPIVSLSGHDVIGAGQVAGTGLTWLYLRVDAEAVTRSRPTGVKVGEVGLDTSGLQDPLDGVCVYAAATAPDGGIEVHARVFVPGYGIPEDPATGSAATGLGLVLVASGLAAADGETAYRISQGVEMGRPSLLLGRVEATEGVARLVHVAGRVVPVASGRIAVPTMSTANG